jgi:hypothetical protein
MTAGPINTDEALRPVTADEADELLVRIETAVRDLAAQLRWAKEHGHPIGGMTEAVDDFADQVVVLQGGIIGCTMGDPDPDMLAPGEDTEAAR